MDGRRRRRRYNVKSKNKSSARERRPHLSFHDFLEGGLEFGHFFLGTYGDADVRGHDGPYAADQDILFCHGIADFLAWTFGVEHEAVRLRRDKGVAVAGEPVERLLTDPGIDTATLGDEIRILQTGSGGDYRGDGHEVESAALQHFVGEIGTGDDESAAD